MKTIRSPMKRQRGGVLLALLVTAIGCDGGDRDAPVLTDDTPAAAVTPDTARLTVADVGFATPESVVHDEGNDLYLVSNINGGPSEKANNGFISRVSPEGEVVELRWIEGGTGNVVLHAPKGVALHGDSLFVADIDSLRIFHRQTGATLGALAIAGAGFLNDVAVGPDGSVYVSDSGIRVGAQGIEQIGTDAVFRVGPTGETEALARGADLRNPNGVIVDGDGLVVVPFGSNEVYRIGPDGERSTVAELPGGQLDGVVRLQDGTLLVSGWEGQAIYRIAPGGVVSTVAEGIEAPADIGYDASRGRLLIPQFNADALIFLPVRE